MSLNQNTIYNLMERELPVNNLPILIIIIDTDFTDLHRRYCPKKLLSFYGSNKN